MTVTTLPEFVSAQPGSWRVNDFATANHEAHHAVCAALLDVEVREARIDRPEYGMGGHVVAAQHPERWRCAAFLIAPRVLDGTAPAALDPLVSDPDAFQAVCYWIESGRPASEWPAFLEFVRDLMLLPASRRAILAVSTELLERGAIPGSEVRRIVREAEATCEASP